MGVRVLFVEDEADARELVAMMLAQDGAEVRTAVSAPEALAACDEWWPDILISDIGMPGEDGYMLIKKLRARENESGGDNSAFRPPNFWGPGERQRGASPCLWVADPQHDEQGGVLARTGGRTDQNQTKDE